MTNIPVAPESLFHMFHCNFPTACETNGSIARDMDYHITTAHLHVKYKILKYTSVNLFRRNIGDSDVCKYLTLIIFLFFKKPMIGRIFV